MTHNPFIEHAGWLDRKRTECARDLDSLKARLDDVSGAPFEERPEQLAAILRQAAGAYRTLERLEQLKEWMRAD